RESGPGAQWREPRDRIWLECDRHGEDSRAEHRPPGGHDERGQDHEPRGGVVGAVHGRKDERRREREDREAYWPAVRRAEPEIEGQPDRDQELQELRILGERRVPGQVHGPVWEWSSRWARRRVAHAVRVVAGLGDDDRVAG